MNIEIEKKYRIENYEKAQNKIEAMGATLEKTKITNDRYFEVPQKIARTKYLRIRFNDQAENGTLAYHEVIDDLQTKEWEIEVDKADIAQQILEKLGFQPEVDVKKERVKYSFENSEILLDKVEDLGAFIEIEAPNLQILNKIAGELELKEENLVSGLGYPDLIKEQNERTIK